LLALSAHASSIRFVPAAVAVNPVTNTVHVANYDSANVTVIDEQVEQPVPLTVAIALAVGGAIMIVMTRHYHREQKHIGDVHDTTIRSALIIGLVQCLALWPGTSRSMVTILAGLGVGLSMIASAEFSFLLALPTLTAATLYKTVSQWPALTASVGVDSLLIGIVISAVVAAFSGKFLIHHLTRHGLAPFGWYRIALASGLLYYFSNLI
jgi:undecaprenyl-diphosphatase